MKTRNVAFICPSTAWGGLEMNVHRLALWLKKRGLHIIFYGNPLSVLFQKLQAENIAVRSLVSKSKFNDIFIARSLGRTIKSDNVSIAVLHLNKNFLLTALARRFSGNSFKMIYMQHMHVGPAKKDFFHNWLYRHLDRWVTPLPLFKNALTEKTNIPPEKIEIIPLGIELERFIDHKPNQSRAREELDLPADVTIAGVVGRLDPKKGQHILIEACHRLHQQGKKLHLLIVGDKSLHEETGYAERLAELVSRYELNDYVHFRPHITDIQYAYSAMDIFTLTSKSETYGMVTIEAMACGLPVIGTDEGGTKDIINDGQSGLLVEPYHAEKLQQALSQLTDNPSLARRLAGRARKDAIDKYSHHRQCDLLENLFEKLRV
ncbi:MAG: glycosyltransferase family 4 protein [Candidatus Zixiibacteriota bacterium]|nr:MAG: glycosyltransferase family 4 protein [candidate division Zixibacteria bacterium]